MRIFFGILSFSAAGLLACHVVPTMHQFVLPYWFQGQSGGGYIQIGYGPIQLSEFQICILEPVLLLCVIGLIAVGIRTLTSV